MTDEQRLLVGMLQGLGYLDVRVLPTGSVAALMPQLFTTGLCFGLTEFGISGRYCYERAEDARVALEAWDGTGDPSGPWIKQKPSERLGPGATGG